MPIYKDITETIGNTPLVHLARIGKGLPATILAKAEFFNPLSSVKDRVAIAMIEDAEKDGRLKRGACIIEPTSGNTGIALAFVSAVKRYRLILTMPDNMSVERKALIEMLGAEVILTPAEYGMRGAIEKAEELARNMPGSFMPRQFENKSNPAAHEKNTAVEIWKDTKGRVDIFTAGIGTGGTIMGVATALKKKNSNIKIIGIEPLNSAVLSGKNPGIHKIQGIGAGFVPKILKKELIDEIIQVSDEEAINYMRRLAKEEGIVAGISSGANVAASARIASCPENRGKNIVTVLCDTGERYLSMWKSQEF